MFGETLKRILNERGKSQKWLADQTGFTEVSISRYVNGSRLPDAYAVRKICNALNCSADELLEIEHVPTADVAPVIHGRWIYKYPGKDIAYCEKCNFYVQDKINCVGLCYYLCPNCGAKMDGKEET